MNQELRIIITQACNYNCYFCHHEGLSKIKKSMLTSEDLSFLYEVSNKYLKINKITLTGGEPFILNGIEDTVKLISELGCDITIVTNGSYLDEKLEVCKYINKLNISLHSLNKCEYEKIVNKKDSFEKIMKNIKLVRREYPNLEINLNCAFIKCEKMYEKVLNVIEFARENSLNVKFIELFPKNCKDFMVIEELEDFLLGNGHRILETNDKKTKFSNTKNNYIYIMKCFCSKALDFESPSEFCNKNNDVFITPDGNAKVCRLRKDEINLLNDIKNRDEIKLSIKLKEAFKNLGKDCPFEKNMI